MPRRWVAPLVGAVLALTLTAGCAGTARPDTGAGNTDVATGGRMFATADQDTAKLGTDAAAGVFPRTITHARGTTTLEKKPQRVVVLDSGELDQVLALGVTPVATATLNGTQPSYLLDKVAGIPTIGEQNALNLEAISKAAPDLILGSKLRVDQLYDKLSAIAPTVLSIRPGFPWKENVLLVGAALGEETKAVEVLNEYQRKADQVKATLQGKPTISLVRFMPGRIRLYGNLSFIGVILRDVGLARPPNQDIHELAVEVSSERIGDANADWIFYSSYGPPTATDQGGVVNGQLWGAIPAVKAGHVHPVDDEVWFLGLGPIGAGRVLDDLPKLLAG